MVFDVRVWKSTYGQVHGGVDDGGIDDWVGTALDDEQGTTDLFAVVNGGVGAVLEGYVVLPFRLENCGRADQISTDIAPA